MGDRAEKSVIQNWMKPPALGFLRRHQAILLAAGALLLYLAAGNRFFYFRWEDNAHYYMLGRALAQGQGYTSVYTFPIAPHTKYPFFFPLMLAGVIRAFGENLIAIKILIALCAAITVGATCRLGEERGDKRIALFAAALAASVPYTLAFSVDVLSEIPYAAWAGLTLLWAERALNKDSAKSPALVAAVFFLLAASFTRSIGIALGPALVGAALLRSPIRDRLRQNLIPAAAIALPFLAAAGAWYSHGYLATRGQGENYFREFFLQDPSLPSSPRIGLLDVIERVQTNGQYYLEQIGGTLWPFSSAFGPDRMTGLGLLLAGIALIGFLQVFREQRGAPELYTLAYVSLILVWGVCHTRFLIPLYPLIIYYLLAGIQALLLGVKFLVSSRPGSILGRIVLSTATLLMLSSNLVADFRFLLQMTQDRRAQGFPINPRFEVIATEIHKDRILTLAVYLRFFAEPGAVVFARYPGLVALASNHPAVGEPFAPDLAGFLVDLEKHRVRYILWDETYWELGRYLIPALKAYPERFRLIYQFPGTRDQIYQYLPAGRD